MVFIVLIWTKVEDSEYRSVSSILAGFSTKELAEGFCARNRTGFYPSREYDLTIEEIVLDEIPPGT